MNKPNLIEKFISFLLVILYDIVSLLWCYIITNNFVYNLTEIQIRESSIGIIGGADLPTWSFIMGGVFGIAFSVLFVVLSLATIFLFTVSIFKKQINRKLNILLCIFLVLPLIVFIFIPTQAYVVSLYILVGKLSFLKYLPILYVIVSLLAIVANALIAIKKVRKNDENILNGETEDGSVS